MSHISGSSLERLNTYFKIFVCLGSKSKNNPSLVKVKTSSRLVM
jgi:hypothetical protein